MPKLIRYIGYAVFGTHKQFVKHWAVDFWIPKEVLEKMLEFARLIQIDEPADTTIVTVYATSGNEDGQNHMPTSLVGHDLAISRPAWANLQIEHAFCAAVEDICERDNLQPEEFVEVAQLQYPRHLASEAVRIAVVAYFDGLLESLPVFGTSLACFLPPSVTSQSVMSDGEPN
jgi:hypothetical protein